MSRQPYVAPFEHIPDDFANLSYDQYRDIRFQKGAIDFFRLGCQNAMQFNGVRHHHSLLGNSVPAPGRDGQPRS